MNSVLLVLLLIVGAAIVLKFLSGLFRAVVGLLFLVALVLVIYLSVGESFYTGTVYLDQATQEAKTAFERELEQIFGEWLGDLFYNLKIKLCL